MKRFYDVVEIAEREGGYQVTLDGRGVKTVGGAAQIVPAREWALALADEWEAQGPDIDPKAFATRNLADYAIDVVAHDRDALVDKLLRYAETDTLLYRADPDEPLFARQQEIWEPVVAEFEAREGVQLVRVSGIVHRPQPGATMAHLRTRLATFDPFALAAIEVMASLAASLIVAFEAVRLGADAKTLWAAASLEEEWQADLWGRDEEAEARRAAREARFLQAAGWAWLTVGSNK